MTSKSKTKLANQHKQQIKEEYELNMADLMELIPTVSVFKQVEKLEYNGELLSTSTKWFVGDYVIYSDMREVRSIEANDEEVHKFFMKAKDYKNFVRACNQRRNELFKQHGIKKK